MSLLSNYGTGLIEAGCDEAGRGCLSGSVFAAAVILPVDYKNDWLNDSKKLTAHQREKLRIEIMNDAVAWSVASCSHSEIDAINILKASWLAMSRAVSGLKITPEWLLIDGNRFKTELAIPFTCIVKGDGKLMSIAAASILAKTFRDDYMLQLHHEFPQYGWDRNKGYPTEEHYKAIELYGITPYHRLTFNLNHQLKLF
ncbi:MAG: ribonuclease HII [Bacteroidales bacterium]|nr:ribonuclease HII [Bacteroidales bacterium]